MGTGGTIKRILVVDDSLPIRELIFRGLTGLGYTVFLAADGEEGHALFIEVKPDAVICDIHMPKMGGMELCKKIRGHGYTMPFLFLTDDHDTGSLAEGLLSGADRYITKPFDIAVLDHHLCDVLHLKEA